MSKEQEWLDRLRAGKKSAYESLYRQHYRMVEHLVARMGGNREDAQDIFQDALFALMQTIRKPGFQLNGKISTLLYAIARNLWLKRQAADKIPLKEDNRLEQLPSDEDNGQSAREKEALFQLVNKSLNELEDDCRAVLRYTFYQNLPHAEIARLMGYTEAFVKVKKFRCLEYLRKMVRKTNS